MVGVVDVIWLLVGLLLGREGGKRNSRHGNRGEVVTMAALS
jgi:hypothetical protein